MLNAERNHFTRTGSFPCTPNKRRTKADNGWKVPLGLPVYRSFMHTPAFGLLRTFVGHISPLRSNKTTGPTAGHTSFPRRGRFFVILAIIAITIAVITTITWMQATSGHLSGIAFGNGRLESTEVDIAAKLPGRVESVLVEEGDLVKPGQVVARMDTSVLAAELREAEAEKTRAEAERNAAIAVIAERQSALVLTQREFQRTQQLYSRNVVEARELDRYQTARLVAEALMNAAVAEKTSAEAAIDVAAAKIRRIQADLDDSVLQSPRIGRVQYRLAEPGEVLPAGGKVVTLIDISDVYMTFFLPTKDAGQLVIGGDARILLDALPDRAIPAAISFVSPIAQFTPKQVETQSEREKLMFRIKVRIDPKLLLRYADRVKVGLPGVAYVKLSPTSEWPPELESDLTRIEAPLDP